MALPPPLPGRTPPLPQRPSIGSIPSGIRDPHASGDNFSPNAARISTRDVQRATGSTFNRWVEFDSTNVMQAKVEPQYDLDGKLTGVGTITIEFVNGAVYEYENRPMGDWFDLIESSSKGRFSYYEVRGAGKSRPGMGIWKPCKQIRKAFRTPAEVAGIQAKRQPVGARQQARTYTRGGQRGAYGAGGKRLPRPPSIQ